MKNFNLSIKLLSGKHIPVVILLLFALLLAFFLPASISNQIKHGAGIVAVPFQKAATVTVDKVSIFFERLFSFGEPEQENIRLKEDVDRLKNLILKQADVIYKLKNEVRSLSNYYDNQKVTEKPLIANVIGYDTLAFRKSLLLDVGTKRDVVVNDIVVFGNALIGRVFSTSMYTSRVQLVTDPDIRLPSRVLETRNQGILTGNSNHTCRMEYVPETANVTEGESVVTSGAGGVYPDSIPIGVIIKVEKVSSHLFQNIIVRPFVDVAKIEAVLVIKNETNIDG